jgi:CheY-like chemotaxis protein
LSGSGFRATQRLSGAKRVESTLELDPGAPPKGGCRLRQPAGDALLNRVRLLALRPTCHFKGKRIKAATRYGEYTRDVTEETRTVLIVDDDPSLRLLCRINLQLEGYAVVEAGNLGEAEHALDNGGVDVVLLDLHLGDEQGSDLVPKIEERGLRGSLALLTGSPGSTLPEGAAVIPKPFAIEDLTGTVRRLATS